MSKTRAALAACILLIFYLAQGCASIQPPPGGPEDKTPPAIDTTTPFNRQTNVATDTRLHFEFSTPLDKASFTQAFTITPYITGTPVFKWSGYDEVNVVLPGKLRPNTTYTVTLNRSLKSRRGNTLTAPYHLTFSTGPQIDTGRLAGFLLPPMASTEPVKTQEVFLFGYDITERKLDTLNLATTQPDVLTQADDKSAYEFLAMKTGHAYRIFAVQDAYRNYLYDVGIDDYGMPTHDATVSSGRDSSVTSGLWVRMAPKIDTLRPELQDAEVTDSLHIRVRFSEALDSTNLLTQNFSVAQSANPLQILGLFEERPDRRPNEITLLLDRTLQPNTEYTVHVRSDSIRDVAGNRLIDSTSTTRTTSPSSLNGAPLPTLRESPIGDSTRSINQNLLLTFAFTDVVDHALIDSAITIVDSSSRVIPYVLRWKDDARVELRSRDTLMPLAFYRLRLRTKFFRRPGSLAAASDTTLLFHFQTADLREDGRVTGDLTIADSTAAKYPSATLVLELIGISGPEHQVLHLPASTRSFAFEKVPKGKYRVRGYLTNRADFTYDTGSVIPWKFAAPSGDFPGEIDVRPRWEIGHVNFEIK